MIYCERKSLLGKYERKFVKILLYELIDNKYYLCKNVYIYNIYVILLKYLYLYLFIYSFILSHKIFLTIFILYLWITDLPDV